MNHLRSTMTEERLAALTLLHFHKDVEICPNEVVKRSISQHIECLKGPLYLTESQPTTDSIFLLHSNNFCHPSPAPSPLDRVAAQMSQPITLTPQNIFLYLPMITLAIDGNLGFPI